VKVENLRQARRVRRQWRGALAARSGRPVGDGGHDEQPASAPHQEYHGPLPSSRFRNQTGCVSRARTASGRLVPGWDRRLCRDTITRREPESHLARYTNQKPRRSLILTGLMSREGCCANSADQAIGATGRRAQSAARHNRKAIAPIEQADQQGRG